MNNVYTFSGLCPVDENFITLEEIPVFQNGDSWAWNKNRFVPLDSFVNKEEIEEAINLQPVL